MSKASISFFIENGWVAVPGAFTAEQAAPYSRRTIERLSLLPPLKRFDEAGRPVGLTLPYEKCFRLAKFAPAAWSLIVELIGGEDRIVDGSDFQYSDGFVVAPPNARGWTPPAREGFRWHIDRDDGDQLRLDTMTTGLVVYGLWNDVEPRGGGTFMAPGAIPALARFLDDHPNGVSFSSFPIVSLLEECDPKFFEMTGALGTIILAHPLLPHAPSLNTSSLPRLLSVKKVELRSPYRFSVYQAERTPVERATLRALGRPPKMGRAKPPA